MWRASRALVIACSAGLSALVLVAPGGTRVAASSPGDHSQLVNLTGEWRANDGATYWIRQIGTTVWWTGFSGSPNTTTMGLSFANVFRGTVSRSSISGTWADVPRGKARSSGTLTLSIRGLLRPTLVRAAETGGFSATTWRKSS